MRLFFALELPESVRSAIVAARDGLALDPRRWRAVRGDTLHVTLRFLGEVEPARLDRILALGTVAAAQARTFACDVEAFAAFPRGSRARIVFASVRDRSSGGQLARLALAVADAAVKEGFPPEERPFAPHVTIARAKLPSRAPRPGQPTGAAIAGWTAVELALMRSHLGPGGSRYELVAAFPFLAPAS